MLSAIYKARPHLAYAFKVAVDCVPGEVAIEQEYIERVKLEIGDTYAIPA
jgi:hypothetical protein